MADVVWRPQPISTHAPLARCDVINSVHAHGNIDFNSRTSCEVRQKSICMRIPAPEFQLTHLLRGATGSAGSYVFMGVFQLTHLLRGATDMYAHLA